MMEPSASPSFSDRVELDGLVAIVTGGARGIGFATAQRLVEAGASVMLSDIDEAAVRAAASRLGPAAEPHVADITIATAPGELVDQAVSRFGGLDIVVNNAGYNWDSTMVEMTDEQLDAMLAIHISAPFRLLRAAGPHLIARAQRDIERGTPRQRKVVNVSSTSGVMGELGQHNYNAGKAAIVGLTKGLAMEWGEFNINVNVVAPGVTATRLNASTTPVVVATQAGAVRIGSTPERRGEFLRFIPLGRMGTPTEVGDVIYFLCTRAADYITGQVINVSGGLMRGMTS